MQSEHIFGASIALLAHDILPTRTLTKIVALNGNAADGTAIARTTTGGGEAEVTRGAFVARATRDALFTRALTVEKVAGTIEGASWVASAGFASKAGIQVPKTGFASKETERKKRKVV